MLGISGNLQEGIARGDTLFLWCIVGLHYTGSCFVLICLLFMKNPGLESGEELV